VLACFVFPAGGSIITSVNEPVSRMILVWLASLARSNDSSWDSVTQRKSTGGGRSKYLSLDACSALAVGVFCFYILRDDAARYEPLKIWCQQE